MNNPFALFDLPVAFNIDNALLSERYLALQKSLHPDNFASSSPAEQRLAMQQSSNVNDALHILKDPIQRAEAIVRLNTGKSQDIEQKSNKDIGFLMQQMEWRETLEEIEQNSDEMALEDFRSDIEQEQKSVLAELENQLTESQWQVALATTDKLRFFRKLLDEIERVEEKLFEI